MKKFFITAIMALSVFAASAKTLVVYYSRNGQNYTSNGIVNLNKGNTQVFAEKIHPLPALTFSALKPSRNTLRITMNARRKPRKN